MKTTKSTFDKKSGQAKINQSQRIKMVKMVRKKTCSTKTSETESTKQL